MTASIAPLWQGPFRLASTKRVAGLLLALFASCADRHHEIVPLPPVFVSLVIQPRGQTIAPLGTVRFQVWGRIASGDSTQTSAEWSASAGSVNEDGLFTAPPGSCTCVVRATHADPDLQDSVVVNVVPTAQSVSLSPSSASAPAGSSALFTARILDAQGAEIPGGVQWSSSDPAVAEPYGDTGLILAKSAGSAVITATSGAVTGTVPITVTPAVARTWPNEPAGFTTVSDQPWSLLTSLNWILEFGTAALGLDLLAPLSPPSVLTITYPAGFPGGEAPGTMTRGLPAGSRAMYSGMWWKPNAEWQGHNSNVNKIQFLFNQFGDIAMVMYGQPNGPYELRVLQQFRNLPVYWLPLATAKAVSLGEWHRIEWLLVSPAPGATAPVGVSRWWLDGVLIGDRSDVPFPVGALGPYKLSPTWGGVGDVKTRTDTFLFDHLYLSVR
jgi:hypothetical protein